MVAPNYAEKRSALAKSMGLGRKASAEAEVPVVPKVPVTRAKKAGAVKAPRAPRVKKEEAAA
jgi:hypothetical protein